jgi:hypothetical protein
VDISSGLAKVVFKNPLSAECFATAAADIACMPGRHGDAKLINSIRRSEPCSRRHPARPLTQTKKVLVPPLPASVIFVAR